MKTFVKDKAIELYGKKTVENMKKTLKSSEPFVIGSMNKETMKDTDYEYVRFPIGDVPIYIRQLAGQILWTIFSFNKYQFYYE